MLTVENVHVLFNEGTPNQIHALRGLNLTAAAGEFVTIVGSNGAGKSTLTNVIAGGVKVKSGRILLDSVDVTSAPAHRRARRVARVLADPLAGTIADMSIEDNFCLAMARDRGRSLRLATTAARRRRITSLIAELGLGLEHRLHEQVGRLSSGQRQSLAMAMAVACRPDVLLLDEHLSALDPHTRERLTDLTIRSARKAGCVTLMITHSMEDAINLGNRLLVMNAGQVIADFSEKEKQGLSAEALLDRLMSSGTGVSDRSLFGALEADRTISAPKGHGER